MPSTPLSNDPKINALLSSYQWGSQNGQGATVSYSFPESGSVWTATYGNEVTQGWSGLDSTVQSYVKAALEAWAEVANITFLQVPDTALGQGQIRVTFSNAVQNVNSGGWAYYPTSLASAKAGDVWLNPSHDYSTSNQGFQLLQHELGHALGLKHPFEPLGTVSTAVLPEAENNHRYTTMAYNTHSGAGVLFTALGGGRFTYTAVLPSTPMLYDVAAIQFLYGANLTTRVGNDTYTFSNRQGEIKTIWDAGGRDTLDLSNQTVSQTIDLNPGQFSSLGVRQETFNGPLLPAYDNIAIAFGVLIENARGGAGDDVILGNDARNNLRGGDGHDKLFGHNGNDTLFGGVGADVLDGGAGADRLDGGPGSDTLIGGLGNDTYVVNIAGESVIEEIGSGLDTVQSTVSWTLAANVERLVLLGTRDIHATGNALNNTLTGNAGHNRLDGGAGNDILVGGAGNDRLTGGSGRDVFLFDSVSGTDTVSDFVVAHDSLRFVQSVFTALSGPGRLADGQFVWGEAALEADDYLIYNRATGALYYDADGHGADPQLHVALLGTSLALTHASFSVV